MVVGTKLGSKIAPDIGVEVLGGNRVDIVNPTSAHMMKVGLSCVNMRVHDWVAGGDRR